MRWTKLQLQFELTECSDHFSSLHLTLAGAGGFTLLAFSPISHKFLPLWGPALHTHIPRVYISIKLTEFFPWLLDCFCWEHPACSLQWTGVWVWDWCNSAIQIVDSPEADLCSQNFLHWRNKSAAKLQCSDLAVVWVYDIGTMLVNFFSILLHVCRTVSLCQSSPDMISSLLNSE